MDIKMDIKNSDPQLTGLIKALEKRGIVVGNKGDGIEIDSNGVFLEGVLPPGKVGVRKRIIRFLSNRHKPIDPASFGFMARLAEKGSKIVIQPLPK